jgi:hypothetical protein
MKNVGTTSAGIVSPQSMGIRTQDQGITRVTDAAIANGGALLTAELEKKDTLLREPLTSVTYARDIPVKTGGGWVEFISALNIDYGVTGGSGDGTVGAAGSNTPPVIQANIDKDLFKTHVFQIVMRIMFVDMQRQAITGRSLDRMLQDGIRLAYDKHMDQNVYLGLPKYQTSGLINHPDAQAQMVAVGVSTNTEWSTKAPEEILTDINDMIQVGWENAEYDLAGMPNHILLPYSQYSYIATQKVSDAAEKTILSFLEENNMATKNGKNLVIAGCRYCAGAGASGTDRAVCYVNDDRFIAVEELVPLARTMTQPNIDAVAYDSVYMANLSEVEVFYPQVINYFDGI